MEIVPVGDPVGIAPELAVVYASAFSIFRDGPAADEVARFGEIVLPAHAARPGFVMWAAREADEVLGFIYGYHGRRGEPWEDWIAAAVPPAVYAEWFIDQFDLAEFCVRADRQGQGIGRALYAALFSAVLPYRRAVLTTRRRDNPARAFYTRRGWELIWETVDARFALMGLRR